MLSQHVGGLAMTRCEICALPVCEEILSIMTKRGRYPYPIRLYLKGSIPTVDPANTCLQAVHTYDNIPGSRKV